MKKVLLVGARTSVIPSPLEDFSPVKAGGSLQFQQLHIKYKGGVGRNDTRVSRGPISHVWGAGDLRPLTQTHLKLGRNIIEQAHTPQKQLQNTYSTASDSVTCATPSSQPLMTSCRPILNLKGLFLSRDESNFFPFCSIPAIK